MIAVSTIMIVEDSSQLASAVAYQLEHWHGHTVTCTKDPDDMLAKLKLRNYDLALVDLLYEHINEGFNIARQAGRIGLTSPRLLVTGLTAILSLQEVAPDIRTVVWTLGEANRRLQLLYAYEELGQRVFCSKISSAEHAGTVADALRAADRGVPYIDAALNSYLPTPGSPKISMTLLRDEVRRAIWRAIALGAHTRADIAKATGYRPHYVGNQIPGMYDDLRALDPGLPHSHQPHIEIVRYAAQNWHFFLDDAIRRAYP
jgi:DNA-binding NarL/FixJ family response regulator